MAFPFLSNVSSGQNGTGSGIGRSREQTRETCALKWRRSRSRLHVNHHGWDNARALCMQRKIPPTTKRLVQRAKAGSDWLYLSHRLHHREQVITTTWVKFSLTELVFFFEGSLSFSRRGQTRETGTNLFLGVDSSLPMNFGQKRSSFKHNHFD